MSPAKTKTPSPKKGKAVAAPPVEVSQPLPQPKAKPKVQIRSTTDQKVILEATRSFLAKKMGQKPIEPNISQLPHIPSGSLVIDNMIGGSMAQDGKGRNCPGWPRRRLIEVYGPEASGKTTVALTAVAECQQMGGIAMFIDMEHALHHGYATRLGVNFKTLLLYAPDTMEDCFKVMLGGIINGVDLIVVDSVASMVPAAEMAKDINAAAQIGIVAQKMSLNLPKFMNWLDKYPVDAKGNKRKDHPGTCLMMLNQTRSKINTGGPPGAGGGEQTPGGRALKFYAYLRLKFSKAGQEKVERTDPISGKKVKYDFGTKTEVQVVKNKVDARNGHKAMIFIRYGFGIDNYYSIIESGVTHGFIKKESGGWFSYKGQRIQGRDKFRMLLIENKALAEEIEQQVISCLVQENVAPAVIEEETEEDRAAKAIEADLASFGGGEVVEEGESELEEASDNDGEEVVDSDDDVATPDDVEASEEESDEGGDGDSE